MKRTFATVFVLAFACAPFFAAHAQGIAAQSRPLEGVIDIHVHTAPDSTPRSIDAIDLARLAQSRGMRALVQKVVPGIQVFGGIDLNLSVGGMNPEAVEKMAETTGHFGRFVWMATSDTCAAVLQSKIQRPCVAVARNNQLLPETKAVIATIARYKLILATGHNSAEDDLLLIREARAQGIDHIVVTHAMLSPTSMTVLQMQQAASLGAYIEFVYTDYAKAIRAIGPAHCILSSDMGQPNNPLHPDALEAFFAGLKQLGLTQPEIDQMSKTNPAKLLNL
jgi:hypothetical protein